MYNTSEKVRDIVSLSLLGAEIGVQSAPTQQECPALWLEKRECVSTGQDPGMNSCTKLIQPTTYIRTCATKRNRKGVSNGRFLTESTQGQAGWGCEQPGLEGGVPAYSGELELDDLKGPFQPKPFYDSMIL